MPMQTYADMFKGDQQLVPGGLRGYRTWNVAGEVLVSTGVRNAWGLADPDELRTLAPDAPLAHVVEQARCLAGNGGAVCRCPLCVTMAADDDHEAPLAACTCGIYGWYQPHDTRIVAADVFGAVEASGRTVLGAHGFRAQRARVLAIASTGDAYLDRRLSGHGYRVLPLRDDVIELYPPDDVSALVQHTCDAQCAFVSSQRARGGMVIIPSSVIFSASAEDLLRAIARLGKPVQVAGPGTAPPAEESPRERALRLKQERNGGAKPWLPASLWRKAVGR